MFLFTVFGFKLECCSNVLARRNYSTCINALSCCCCCLYRVHTLDKLNSNQISHFNLCNVCDRYTYVCMHIGLWLLQFCVLHNEFCVNYAIVRKDIEYSIWLPNCVASVVARYINHNIYKYNDLDMISTSITIA